MITVFANSTLYTVMPDADTTKYKGSCLDYLRESYNDINGNWINGATVLSTHNVLQNHLRERGRHNHIILNLGCVECYSHPAKNLLYWYCHYMNLYKNDRNFECYILPKMWTISKDLVENIDGYYQILNQTEFNVLFDLLLKLLEGFSIICIGISKPNLSNPKIKDYWHSQAVEYEKIIREKSTSYNNVSYIDCWNNYSEYVVDTTHMRSEGHIKLFREIQERV